MRGSSIVAASVLGLSLGCSTTSTIGRVNGPTIEGDIVGGSPDSIFVAREAGGEDEIPRQDISSIDYPGNVHEGVGAGVLAYGILNIAVAMPKCERTHDNQAAYCTGVFLPAALGAGMIIWGLVVHHGQTSAVEDTSRESGLKLRKLRIRAESPPKPSQEQVAPPAASASAAPASSAPPEATPPAPAAPVGSTPPAAAPAPAPTPAPPPAPAPVPPTKTFTGTQ